MKQFAYRLAAFFRSKRFFYVVIGFFILEALWFALSAMYPMAFDEDFHFGIITIYAEQWSPFLATQPAGGDVYGALVSDPSYLFHYLMSFPYRLVALFTDSQSVQVIVLRLLNVLLFAYSLVLFRRVLLRAKISQALTHVSLALFVLIPIVPMLAAHINYDNLFMVLLAWMCLLAFDVIDGLRSRQLAVKPLSILLVVWISMALVKYAALPIVLGAAIFLAYMGIRSFWGHGGSFIPALKHGVLALSRGTGCVLLGALLIGSVLFVQRYGVNMYRYHTPVPECDAVLSVGECKAYGPWRRNHVLHDKRGDINESPLFYTTHWLWGMWHRMFFAVNGPLGDNATRFQLPIPADTFIALAVLSLVALIAFWRRVFRGRAYLGFFLCVIVVYCGLLFFEEYSQYVYTGQPVAINGRYLIPLLLLMAALAGRAFSVALGKRTALKALAASIVLLLFLHGGGVMTFILRSDKTWYWDNAVVLNVNETAQDILRPIIIEGSRW